MFNSWINELSPDIELNLIHLPGRDKRLHEPMPENLSTMVGLLGEALYSRLDKPFVFFGHSMGALISFEVARILRKQHSLQPVHLFCSGRQAPHLSDPHAFLHQLPEQDFLRTVEELFGNLPNIVKENLEILKLFLSILRADLRMIATHRFNPELPLDCPITVFGGSQDKSVTEEELDAWCDQTTGSFTKVIFPDSHFFIQNMHHSVVKHINQILL